MTLVPALVVRAGGADPTAVLVVSQAVLSLGIPFALVPLVRLAGDRRLLGGEALGPAMRSVLWTVAVLVVALNVALITLLVVGAL